MKFHHVALIVSDLDRAIDFYVNILGLREVHRSFRPERNSHKVDLVLGEVRIELFTFPGAPPRPSYPEALGLRHLALTVSDIETFYKKIGQKLKVEEMRVDPITGKKFFFFPDPDNQPIEIYEA